MESNPGLSLSLAFLIVWIVALGLEVAMHARPRSRGLSIAALLGWTVAIASFVVVPFGRSGEWDETILGAAMEAGERRGLEPGHLVVGGIMALALVAWLQVLRRCGADRERAAARRFKTAWIAFLLLPTPMILLYAAALFSIASSTSGSLATFHNGWSFVFASMFGGALGVSQMAVLMVGYRPPAWALRATGAGFVGAALSVAIIAALPDRREPRAGAFLQEVGDAIVAGLRAQPVPERFLGGYAEFDLRSAATALEGYAAPGAPLRVRAIAMHFAVNDGRNHPFGWAIWMNDELHWLGSRDFVRGGYELDHLASLDPGLSDLLGFAWDGTQSISCLPPLDDTTRAELGSTFDGETDFDSLCNPEAETPRLFGPEAEALQGTVDAYRLVVETPEGILVAFEGTLRFESILWVGCPVPYPIAQPGTHER